MREPTAEECRANARATLATGARHAPRELVAAWYPQMGGYVGKCWIELHACGEGTNDPDDGFDVYVWHDGEFPFSEEGREPICLHHCAPSQFIEFGELVQKLGKAPQ